MTISKAIDKPINIMGIYAPANARDRRRWLKNLNKEMEKDVGYRVIAGDFNFITKIQLDKRGGNTKNGTIGRKEQSEIEKKYEVRDIWRE